MSTVFTETADPFVIDGDDWFPLTDESGLSWSTILDVVDREQTALATIVAEIDAGHVQSPLAPSERLNLVLGITCHAVYHAGQMQLIRRLAAGTTG